MKTSTKQIAMKFAFEINRKIPERGYEVETLVEMPMVDGEADYDNAKYKRVYVATHDEAIAKASELLPGDFWGGVQITEYELCDRDVPMCNFIEYLGETEYIELKYTCHKCGRLITAKRYLCHLTTYWVEKFRVHKDKQGEYCAGSNLSPPPAPPKTAHE